MRLMQRDRCYNHYTDYGHYEACGYEEPLDDMLLLGSTTLANCGISPATGKRVLSAASVDAMLCNTRRKLHGRLDGKCHDEPILFR